MVAKRPIYLDHQATTPVDSEVVTAMLPYFTEHPGNPSSSHLFGWEAEAAVKQARRMLADVIRATPEEIIFTSGATEANNLAIKGIAEAYLQKGRHIVTVQTEHNAVLEPCRYLETLGFEVTYLPVQDQGLIDLNQLEQTLRSDTVLVSVMAANNEIGVLQPLAEIGALCQRYQVLFHTDAAQAIDKIPLDVKAMQIDLLSITAHKLYGPKGIGALYLRRGIRMASQLHGGGQEKGLRSGTLAAPLIVGLGKAVELAMHHQAAEGHRLAQLRDNLWDQLQKLEGIYLNGHPTQHLPGCLNISVAGVDGTRLLRELQPNLAVSSGAACASAKPTPSHVLTALGRDPALARASLRFGMGRFNTAADINQAASHVITAVQALRQPHRARSIDLEKSGP
ncbi:MAG: cysteine desulfurase family protein [Cyanobacteria bacterium P01_A01_bin.17]